jgi:hypothetical protein
MFITEVLKQELTQWIETYWATYLKGDLETWATFLRDDYRNIGGTKEEIWNSKQEILEYTTWMMDQMKGHVEFRNREIDIIPYGSQVMLHEFTDVYIMIEGEWILYGPFRMSSLLEKTEKGWMALHQHGSYPDMKAMEGEAFSTNALKAENARLLEAVKVRTNELEIEASLERVRSAAMGMKKPDDMLDVCRVIAAQLQQFGVDHIRNVQTAIINENIGQYLCYQYFPAYEQPTIEDTQYQQSPVENEMVRQMIVSRNGHFIGSLTGKELDTWRTHRKEVKQFSDPLLDHASVVSYSFLSIGEGGLGLSLYRDMEEKVLILFKRFHQVFNLAYQRFRDIQIAEAQAREAQIEAALERVRAASMAMMDSSALSGIIYKLYAELTKLDAKLDRAFIMIVNPENQGITWWLAGKEGLLAENGFFIQKNQHPSHLMYLDCWQNRKKKWQYLFEGKEKKDWDRFGFIETELSRLPDFIKEDMAAVKSIYLSGSSDQFGLLVTGSLKPLPKEQQDIISRFTTAFNQAYIRFLDLQKAEAQAREAQIEAALERVRARAMAMHNSVELSALVATLFEELKKLDLVLARCIIWIFNPETFDARIWMANSEDKKNTTSYFINRLQHPYYDAIIKGWKEKVSTWVYELKGSEKKNIDELLLNETELSLLSDEVKVGIKTSEHTVISGSFNTFGLIEASGPSQQTVEQLDILHRFGKVFDSSYTRFNDLKNAEAQAREAHIEAALERVRSRYLAMHNSNDVGESVATLFDELTALGVLTAQDRYGIGIMQPDEMMEAWTAAKSPEGKAELTIGHINMKGHGLLESAYKGWVNKSATNHYILEGDDKLKYYDTIKSQSDYKIKRDYYSEQTKIVHTDFYFNEGCLYVFSKEAFSDQSIAVFIRFAGVFAQTYRRYLDLRYAEALALDTVKRSSVDRVRAEIASMRTKKDLESITPLIWRELTILGIDFIRCGVFIMDEKTEEIQTYLSTPDGKSLSTFRLGYDATASIKADRKSLA